MALTTEQQREFSSARGHIYDAKAALRDAPRTPEVHLAQMHLENALSHLARVQEG